MWAKPTKQTISLALLSLRLCERHFLSLAHFARGRGGAEMGLISGREIKQNRNSSAFLSLLGEANYKRVISATLREAIFFISPVSLSIFQRSFWPSQRILIGQKSSKPNNLQPYAYSLLFILRSLRLCERHFLISRTLRSRAQRRGVFGLISEF